MRYGSDPDFSLMPELFAPPLRPHLQVFGRFVRLADAIVDDAFLTAREKVARLDALERGLDSAATISWSLEADAIACSLRESLCETQLPKQHLRDLIDAFRADAQGAQKESWADLMAYCRQAAAPIGRYTLQLAGEDLYACGNASDCLCAALRILKQVRDCKDLAVQYNRLCIPLAFLADAKITHGHLRGPVAKGQTRAVIDRVLDGVDHLLAEARPLPWLIRARGPAAHAAIVLCRARKLARHFRKRDPLQQRVGLSASERLMCRWFGIVRTTLRR